MIDFFNPSGRGTGFRGSVSAVNELFGGMQNREQNELARQQKFLQLDEQRKGAMFQDAREVNTRLAGGDIRGATSILSNRLQSIEQLGGDPTDTLEILGMVQSGNLQGAQDLLNLTEKVGMQTTDSSGRAFLTDPRMLEAELSRAKGGTKQQAFNSLLTIAENDPDGETLKGKAALIELGIIAKASTSAAERIANDDVLARKVAKAAQDKATASEAGKLSAQLKHKPSIAKAVKLAENQATEQGDVFTALNRSQAALPGLTVAVDELKELSKISTSTFGGRLFDAAIKETGFGSTKGATGRAKFIAIVNNQVLPLLKETFGAAFTFQEGEALKATMGDPNASPEEKTAQLDAFIAQKTRDIETKQRQLAQPGGISGDGGEFSGFKVVR